MSHWEQFPMHMFFNFQIDLGWFFEIYFSSLIILNSETVVLRGEPKICIYNSIPFSRWFWCKTRQLQKQHIKPQDNKRKSSYKGTTLFVFCKSMKLKMFRYKYYFNLGNFFLSHVIIWVILLAVVNLPWQLAPIMDA